MNLERVPRPPPPNEGADADAGRAFEQPRQPKHAAASEPQPAQATEAMRAHIESTIAGWGADIVRIARDTHGDPDLRERQIDALTINSIAGALRLGFDGGDTRLRSWLEDKGAFRDKQLDMRSPVLRFITENTKASLIRHAFEQRNAAHGVVAATGRTWQEVMETTRNAARDYVPPARALEYLREAPKGAPAYRNVALDRLFTITNRSEENRERAPLNHEIRETLRASGVISDNGAWDLTHPATKKLIQETVDDLAKRVPNMDDSMMLTQHVEESLRFRIGKPSRREEPPEAAARFG